MKLRGHIALIFILILGIITGCKHSDQKMDLPTRMFEETAIQIPDKIKVLSISKISDNKYICSYIDPLTNRYHLAYTDPSFTNLVPIQHDAGMLLSTNQVAELDNSQGHYSIGSEPIYDIDENGDLYILQFEVVQKDNHIGFSDNMTIFVYQADGKLKKQITLEQPSMIRNMSPKKLIAQANRYLVIAENGIQIVDHDGRTIEELAISFTEGINHIENRQQLIPTGRIIDADMIGNNELVIIQSDLSNSKLSLYHLDNQKTSWSNELPSTLNPLAVHYDETFQQIFLLSNSKVHVYDKEGNDLGEFINFFDYGIGHDLLKPMSDSDYAWPYFVFFSQHDVMNVYLISKPPTSNITKAYAYRLLSEEERAARYAQLQNERASKTNITIHVPYIDSHIETLIARYQQANPHVNINLKYFRKNMEEFNQKDYVQYVNVQLFTKKLDWDVLAVQFLPYQEYAEKGYLADLEQIEPAQWGNIKENYFSNLLDALRVNNKLTILPARILMNVNIAEKSAADQLTHDHYTWDDMIALSAKWKERTPSIKTWNFGLDTHRMAYSRVLGSFQPDILNESNQDESRRQLLDHFIDTIETVSDVNDQAQLSEQPLFNLMPFFPEQFQFYIDQLGVNKILLPAPASPQTGKHAFTLQDGYAINPTSKVKEEALSFILFLSENGVPSRILCNVR